jgi:hypothetical protein
LVSSLLRLYISCSRRACFWDFANTILDHPPSYLCHLVKANLSLGNPPWSGNQDIVRYRRQSTFLSLPPRRGKPLTRVARRGREIRIQLDTAGNSLPFVCHQVEDKLSLGCYSCFGKKGAVKYTKQNTILAMVRQSWSIR